MNNCLFYFGADTAPLRYARDLLEANGCAIAPFPSHRVTHLVLNSPTFDRDGSLIGGGKLPDLLQEIPQNTTVIGGNLAAPILNNYITSDLLQNESYLAENAAITAECALQVAFDHFPAVIRDTPILILGWGRIAKCLSKLLSAVGAQVTVAARNETALAMARALGFGAVPISRLDAYLSQYRIIFNTIPAVVLPEPLAQLCRKDCLKIELASTPGIIGNDVITARGLPGKLAPESSGNLIAKTVLSFLGHKEVSS